MRNRGLLLPTFLIIFTFFAAAASAQHWPCEGPAAPKFAEVEFGSRDEMNSTIREFRNKLIATPKSKGLVVVFGGAKSHLNEIPNLISYVENAFEMADKFRSIVDVVTGGYRHNPAAVFIFKPVECSNYPVPEPDFTAEKVEFAEFPRETTIALESDEIEPLLEDFLDFDCSAASVAIRACSEGTEVELFIIVDTTGKVQFVQGISGHVLNRWAASTVIRRSRFQRLIKDGHAYNFSGVFKFRFRERLKSYNNCDHCK